MANNNNEITTEIEADNQAPTTQDPITGAGSLAPIEAPTTFPTETVAGIRDLQPQFDLGIEQPVTQAPQEQIDRLREEAVQPEPVIEPTAEPTPTTQPRVTTQPAGRDVPAPVTPAVEVKETEQGIKSTDESIKSQELANKGVKEEQKRVKDENTLNQFNQMIRSGASDEDIQKFLRKNPRMQDQFKSALKESFRTRADFEFNQTFANASNDELQSAQQSGELVIGSTQYNRLPPETRKRFEAFNKLQNSNKATDFSNDNENVLSFDNFASQLQGIFGSDIRTRLNDIQNSPEIKRTRSNMSSLQGDINQIDESLESLEDDVRDQFKKLPLSLQNAEIAKRQKNLIRQKNSKLNQYNTQLGLYKDMKNDIDTEFKISGIEDANKKFIYSEALKQYNSARGEMKEDARLKFLQENKEISTQKAFENQRSLLQFKNDLDKGDIKGKWSQRFDGLYFLQDDGVAKKVVDGGFEGFADGSSTYVYLDDDGTPIVENRDINGTLIGAGTGNTSFNQNQIDLLNATNGSIIPTRLSEVTNANGGKECAEYINDIFVNAGIGRMGDTFESKLAVATEADGKLGSVAVWQPNPSNKEFSQFGHAGVIVGESDDEASWHIKSSNLNLDGKISIVAVPKSVISGYKSTELFQKPDPRKDLGLNALAVWDGDASLGDFTPSEFGKVNAELKKAGFFDQSQSGNSKYQKLKTKDREGIVKLFNLKARLDEIEKLSVKIDTGPVAGRRGRAGEQLGLTSEEFINLDILTGKTLVEFMKEISGAAISDREVERLSALIPNVNQQDKRFDLSLRQLQDEYSNLVDSKSKEFGFATSRDFQESLGLNAPVVSEDVIHTDADGVTYTKLALADEFARLIDSGELTEDQVRTYIANNNIILN